MNLAFNRAIEKDSQFLTKRVQKYRLNSVTIVKISLMSDDSISLYPIIISI